MQIGSPPVRPFPSSVPVCRMGKHGKQCTRNCQSGPSTLPSQPDFKLHQLAWSSSPLLASTVTQPLSPPFPLITPLLPLLHLSLPPLVMLLSPLHEFKPQLHHNHYLSQRFLHHKQCKYYLLVSNVHAILLSP